MVEVYTDYFHRTVVIASCPSENTRAGNWVLSPGFLAARWVRLRDNIESLNICKIELKHSLNIQIELKIGQICPTKSR